MRSLTVISEPATTPVSLAEAKLHLRVDSATEDAYITTLIAAATNVVESVYLWRSLVTRTYTLKDTITNTTVYALAMPPVQGVSSITVDGVEPAYTLDGTTGVLTFSAPVSGALEMEYVAGYATVPAQFRQAILLLVGTWYESREAATFGAQPAKVPYTIELLTLPYKARTA